MIKQIDTYVTESDLLLYPEVNWDRFGRDYAFGWIPRDDGKFDFAMLTYQRIYGTTESPAGHIAVSIISSSAKYNQEFGKRLGATDHQDCKRIEHYFEIPNKVILKGGDHDKN